MIRMIQSFLALMALCVPLIAAVPAQALEGPLMKGSTLRLLCTSSKEEDAFSCQNYIAGIVDYHNLLKSLGAAPSVDFCVPGNVPMAQIKQVVLTYLASHTEHQDFIASPGVVMALYNAYPCPKKKRR